MESMNYKSSPLRSVATDLPFFKTVDERELLLGVIGALTLRRISLNKASEIMGMGKDTFLDMLDAMNVSFSFLEPGDIKIERNWK